jgi:hypothetical protein
MKNRTTFLLIALFVLAALPINAAPGGASKASNPVLKDPKPVIVYYFHATRRCATCLSIERITRGVIKDRYKDDKRVTFLTINVDEEKNATLAERYEVAGSGLIVCSGKKNTDLTTKAFQYAKSDPGKLQSALIKAIDGYLK